MGKGIQELAREIEEKIRGLGILDINKYVRGVAGKPKDEDKCYRARFAMILENMGEVGKLEKFLKKNENNFGGKYTFIIHHLSENPKMRLLSLDEPYGKPSEQERTLIADLHTLSNLLDNYLQQKD